MSRQQKVKENEQPTIVDELLEKGQVILTATTREELNEQFAKIATEVEGAIPSGAISHGFDGCMTLRVELITKK